MKNKEYTIVLVLRSGGDFAYRDVELISRHIVGKWKSKTLPRIICFWDNASQEYDLGQIKLIPFKSNYPGTWSRIILYSPYMEQFKPFLYVDLDTIVVNSIENILDLIEDESKFVTLEDFYQSGKLATGLVWFPKNCPTTQNAWKKWKGPTGWRMDYYLRGVCKPDFYWQQLTNTVYDFKPKEKGVLKKIPENADLICFHGKPRIFDAAANSMGIGWVKDYVNQMTFLLHKIKKTVTVIIPYKEDRGWLKDAVASVPDGVQLLLSKGDGNWPHNFNEAFPLATGDYIKYLHEDDMLAPNCIADSIKAMEEQNADFIHGQAIEMWNGTDKQIKYSPSITHPTLQNLIRKNVIHSPTLMYRREVFEKVGLFNESKEVYSFEEYEFNLRCLKAGMKIGYSPTVLAFYRRHPKQAIRIVNKVERESTRKELLSAYK